MRHIILSFSALVTLSACAGLDLSGASSYDEYVHYNCSSLQAEKNRLLEKRTYILQKQNNDFVRKTTHVAGVVKDIVDAIEDDSSFGIYGANRRNSPYEYELSRVEDRYDFVSRELILRQCEKTAQGAETVSRARFYGAQ